MLLCSSFLLKWAGYGFGWMFSLAVRKQVFDAWLLI
jgi:hypothetical protein